MTLMMKFRNIQGAGEAQETNQWIHMDSCSFNISNAYMNALQKEFGNKMKANVSCIHMTRTVDESTSQIIAAVANAEVGNCQIHLANTSVDDTKPLISLILEKAQITEHGFDLNQNGVNKEHMSITFSKYKFNYTPISSENKQKAGYLFVGHTEHHDDDVR